MAKALCDSSFDLMEVMVDHAESVGYLARLPILLCGSVLLGAGTVCAAEQRGIANDAGAQLIMSPGVDGEVAAAHEQNRPVFPSVLTPTESKRAQGLELTCLSYVLLRLLGRRTYRHCAVLTPPLNLSDQGNQDRDREELAECRRDGDWRWRRCGGRSPDDGGDWWASAVH